MNLGFCYSSFVSSISECIIVGLIGGISILSVWFLILETGFDPSSVQFVLLFSFSSIVLIWYSIFWIKVLFIPGNRGKISVFAPIPIRVNQHSFKTDGILAMVSIAWVSIWAFIVILGISLGIRKDPVFYKSNNNVKPSHHCCQPKKNNFSNWFKDDYLTMIRLKQNETFEKRQFIVFHPFKDTSFNQIIDGLFTAFALSIISGRELLIDIQPEICDLLKNPGWIWRREEVFHHLPFNYEILDFTQIPSFIVAPAHKWRWSDILHRNLTSIVMTKHQVVLLDSDEFLAPLFWSNPNYRTMLCSICDITEIYFEFSGVFLNFADSVNVIAQRFLQNVKSKPALAIFDDHEIRYTKMMQDTAYRCLMMKSEPEQDFVVYFGKKFLYINHTVHSINNSPELIGVNSYFLSAVLFIISSYSSHIIGFSGSKLSESLAYSFNKPFYRVLRSFPLCDEVPIRIPCLNKWIQILNSPSMDIGSFMVAEFNNYDNCNL